MTIKLGEVLEFIHREQSFHLFLVNPHDCKVSPLWYGGSQHAHYFRNMHKSEKLSTITERHDSKLKVDRYLLVLLTLV